MEIVNGFTIKFHEAGANSYWSAIRETRGARWVYTRKNKASLIRHVKRK